MVFGMVEFGRTIMVQQVLTNSSREGARMAVLDGATTSAVQTYLQNGGVSNATVSVSPDPPGFSGYGEPATVTVSVSFNQVSWLPTPMFVSGSTQLTATTVMRRETVQ